MEQIQKLIKKWHKERVSTINYITENTKPNSKERHIMISKETTLSDCIQDLRILNGDTEKGVANCDNCKHNTVPLKNHPCKHCINGVNFEQFE